MKLAGYNWNSECGQLRKRCRKSSARCRAAGLRWKSGRIHPGSAVCWSELGHEVIVANARKVRLIGESRKKDDRLDAQTLARLARIDPELLYPVKHRSAQAQADLMMIRARAGLVRARTGLVNTARGLAKSYGERLRGCNVRNMDPEAFLAGCPSFDAELPGPGRMCSPPVGKPPSPDQTDSRRILAPLKLFVANRYLRGESWH